MSNSNNIASEARKALRKFASKKDAQHLQRFFKTGKGEYGEGDVFIGVRVPDTRSVAKKFKDMRFADVKSLLKSRIHEERLLALLILVQRFEAGSRDEQKKIVDLYLKHTKYINNWDLVDLSSHHILGTYLLDKDRAVLYGLAKSKLLWDRRISVVSTFEFIRRRDLKDVFKLSRVLIGDEEDLMHKAVGWMLREAGKRDMDALEDFLKRFYAKMPRTMLRYAIEKFPEERRQQYLKGLV